MDLTLSKHFIELIQGKFYYVSGDEVLQEVRRANKKSNQSSVIVNFDKLIKYVPFAQDFGPLNLSQVVKFTRECDKQFEDPKNKKKKIIAYTSYREKKKLTNSVFLVSAYMVLSKGFSIKATCNLFKNLEKDCKLYCDASVVDESNFKLRMDHCLKGLQHGLSRNFFNVLFFDSESYDHFEQVENGDLNWIIPNKIIAFSGPQDLKSEDKHPPGFYVPYFLKHNVKIIFRLNSCEYDPKSFTDAGIKHVDLFFEDGTAPDPTIVDQFLNLTRCYAEGEEGAIAVHCKAGLGRTGTLIACYLMQHYNFTYQSAIAYIRIVRPGSIVGPQQLFLKTMQPIIRMNAKENQKKRGLIKKTFKKGRKIQKSNPFSTRKTIIKKRTRTVRVVVKTSK
eukprot:TRINITY_DN10787_c0_g1_i1.p1 TRINITY_DN10787_c0_g1~~TRINITY_DN10787_c0_g1_i1.p1  ORF type:complete len:391 (+),score=49.35 TRINITY_DN10787_c0_g1_i1:29-1201(+)